MFVSAAALAGLFSMPVCAPISRRILYGIVRAESGGDAYAVHDDSDSRSWYPRTYAAAAGLVIRLERSRHAFSVGLAQVENVNFLRFRVTGVDLLDPRLNVAIGCALYREAVPALRAYNTGSAAPSAAGNRYVEAVFTAGRVVSSSGPVARPRPKPRRQRRAAPPRVAVAAFGFSVRARRFGQ